MSPAALFFSCVAIWGTTWIAVTFQVAATAPEFGVALRFTLAALALLLFCYARGIVLALDTGTQLRLALLGALGFCLSYLFVYHAQHYIVSGLIAVGYSAIPLVNMVLARLIFGTPMSRRVALGGTLGLAGIALIFWPEFARSWIVVAATGVPTTIRWSWAFGLSLGYLVLAGSVLAFGAYYALLAKVGAARAGYVGVMSTVVALIVSALFEGYDWRAATVVGIALAVAGNVLALQPARRPTGAPPTAGRPAA